MKQQGDVVVGACRLVSGVLPMAAVSPSAVSANSQAQRPFPTPSPFSFSVASTSWSSRLSIHRTSLILRFLALMFSFVSAVSLAAPSSEKKGQLPSSFAGYSELMYSFVVHILVFLYSAFQLFKGVCDIAHRGILISDMVSDYLSFILDQLVGYLLISSCSVAIMAAQHISRSAPLWKATIVSVSMSFATFLIIVACTLFSGYKLCKRIIW
ncbi:CASP-like protein 4A4 [Mercurialis annua]|uniref:CASP-like protein 4A4 n=1 Tax=Mercurialis annua TaxID=3986 RepID=UPI00215DDA33|nr:CASP-like protein 4A4 [Mercurialis annua]